MWADGQEIPLNPFVSALVGNVIRGIVSSLKIEGSPAKEIEFRMHGKDVTSLEVEGKPISLQLTSGFAQTIAGSTLRGLVQPIEGTKNANEVIIRVEEGKR